MPVAGTRILSWGGLVQGKTLKSTDISGFERFCPFEWLRFQADSQEWPSGKGCLIPVSFPRWWLPVGLRAWRAHTLGGASGGFLRAAVVFKNLAVNCEVYARCLNPQLELQL